MIGQLLTGRYLILEKLGRGGFSETYLARDKYLPQHPLCVVKLLKPSINTVISTETAQQLFEAEAHLLEWLGQQHSQIPTLLAYCHHDHQVYLVQEYIDGENLSVVLKQKRSFTSDDAIALLLEVLPILDFLHSHGIIHCDIKLSNLIRRRHDGAMVLIDFGAACRVSDRKPNVYAHGDRIPLTIGTVGYMPEEQHQGRVEFSSDLYALGLLVIHLLTGVHPREFKRDDVSGELNWQRHRGEQPVQPELITILNRMVRINASDRYSNASHLLQELHHLPFLKPSAETSSSSGLKPSAESGQVLSQSSRLAIHPPVHRWKMALPSFLPTLLLILLGMLGGTVLHTSGQQAMLLLDEWQDLLHSPHAHVTQLHNQPIPGDIQHMTIAPNNRTLVTTGSDRIMRVWSLPNGTLVRSLNHPMAPITTLSITPDSQRLMSGGEDGNVRLWDMGSGELLRTFKGDQAPITQVLISPDASTFISQSQDGTLRYWNLRTRTLLRTLPLPGTQTLVGVWPNRLIRATRDRQLQVWDLHTGQLERTFAGHTQDIVTIQVLGDRTVVSFGHDRGLVWDLAQETLVRALSEEAANPLATAVSDRHIMTINRQGRLCIWVVATGKRLRRKELGPMAHAAVSPDQSLLVSWNSDRHLHIWQIQIDAS